MESQPLATSAHLEDEIDLRYYWRVIFQQRWNIVALAMVFSILAALTVLAMRPVFRSTLTLMIESQEAKVLSIEEVYGLGSAATRRARSPSISSFWRYCFLIGVQVHGRPRSQSFGGKTQEKGQSTRSKTRLGQSLFCLSARQKYAIRRR